jgi:hypothetical protein
LATASTHEDAKARAIWRQKWIPVIYSEKRGRPLKIRLPYAPGNYNWLRGDRQRKPAWNKRYKCWETPYAWLDYAMYEILERFGRVYLIQSHSVLEKCARDCWEAKGFECQCSCLGANHGSQSGARWFEVSETLALSWQSRKLSCRLIVKAAL